MFGRRRHLLLFPARRRLSIRLSGLGGFEDQGPWPGAGGCTYVERRALSRVDQDVEPARWSGLVAKPCRIFAGAGRLEAVHVFIQGGT